MRTTVLPDPPAANDPAFNMKVVMWMGQVKSILELNSRVNDTPLGQRFVVGSFTTNTTISGTSTGTDVSNFLASFISAMTSKGIVSPTINRTS